MPNIFTNRNRLQNELGYSLVKFMNTYNKLSRKEKELPYQEMKSVFNRKKSSKKLPSKKRSSIKKRPSKKRSSIKRRPSKKRPSKKRSVKRRPSKKRSVKRRSPKKLSARRYLNPATGKYSLKKKASVKVWKMHKKRGTLKTGPASP